MKKQAADTCREPGCIRGTPDLTEDKDPIEGPDFAYRDSAEEPDSAYKDSAEEPGSAYMDSAEKSDFACKGPAQEPVMHTEYQIEVWSTECMDPEMKHPVYKDWVD